MSRVFHWIGGTSHEGIPVAICLEHDLVCTAPYKRDLPDECTYALRASYAADRKVGNDPTTLPSPPVDVVAKFSAMLDAWEFTVTLEEES